MKLILCLLITGFLFLSPAAGANSKLADDAKRPWTLLLYGAVDNSVDDPFVAFTDKVRQAIDDDPGIEVILFIDRSSKHAKRPTFLGEDFQGARLYRVKKHSVERLPGGGQFPEIAKDGDVQINSADASTLQRFISWGKANYPARNYGLLIYSHGTGKAMCPDDRTGSWMGIAELTDKIGVKERLDFLALELCNMGGIEIAYQWRPGNGGFEADVLLAIPNGGPSLDWDRAFRRIRSPGHAATGGPALDPAKMTAVDFGKLVIEEGHRGRQASERPGGRGSKESAGCYDLRKAAEVKQAVDALAVALAKSQSKSVLRELRSARSEGRLISYSQDSSYVDLYDLCRRMAGCHRLPEPVRSAARDVMTSVQGFMIASFGMSGYPQFEAGKNGVFIVLPSGKPNCWKEFRWYTPTKGERGDYGNWSFLKDGATPGNGVVENWYELLDAWFNGQQREQKPTTIAELQSAIEAVLHEMRIPGAGIAIVSRDKIEWVAGLGVADVARKKAATAETLFRIASISKSFAALAALKLQEEGKLKLTDTVKQWVPEVGFSNRWEATDPVRLVHLMEHTTGFGDIHLREYAHDDSTPIALKEALANGEASRVSRWRPGTRMAYGNSGPAILAAVIEKVSGQRFEDYVQEHFFRPLHMDTASYFLTPDVESRLTGLYHADGVTTYPYWHFCFRPSGAMNASAKDMANYVRFYLQRGSLDGTLLLHPSSIERMERTETLPSARLGNIAGYGLYNDAMPEGAFTFRGHGGAIMGALSEMAYLPDAGRGYAAMINSGNGHALLRITRLIRAYLVRDLTPPPLPLSVSVPAELQRHYGGYYQIISPSAHWFYAFARLAGIKKLTFTSDALSASSYGFDREKWMPVSPRLYRKENQSAATLALLPDEDGKVLVQCGWLTFKKVSALRIWSQAAGIGLVSSLVLSSVLFAPVWVARMILGKLRNAGPLSVRVMPLLGAAFLIVFDVAFAIGMRGSITRNEIDDLTPLGTPSALSITIMLSSIAFALATLASLYVLYRERRAAMNRVIYWHSLAVTGSLLGVAIYYGYWGLIGVRLWA